MNVSVFEEHVNVTAVTFRVYVKDHVNLLATTVQK